jgi:hypothetical protein
MFRFHCSRAAALPLACAAVCALLAGGCGGHPQTAPVTGKVTLHGKPVGPGSILFMPDEDRGTKGKAASGNFGPDGAYTLTTYRDGDGAVVGFHKVTIRLISAPAAAENRGSVERPMTPTRTGGGGETDIRVKYANVQRPLLSAEVSKGGGPIDFDLK